MDFELLPKIELHCHLDGSVRPETILDIATKENIEIPTYDLNQLRGLLEAPLECKSLVEYLDRFNLPIKIMQSKESLRRITYELLEDAAKENVKYIEIRYAPVLHTENGLTIEQVIESVIDGIKQGEKDFNIKANLILSCLRHRGADSAATVVEAGKKFLDKGVVAVDLAGAENEGFAKEFVDVISIAREYGYRVTIHAGETGIGLNVVDAIKLLHAERIGHGVAIKDLKEAYDLVKENNVTLEMCPTSNMQTKAVKSYEEHPLFKFYKDGIRVSFNTDNRTVSATNITGECKSIDKVVNMTHEDYKKIYNDSVDATFATEEVKAYLKTLI
ncbi:MAG TPA: adenosine deaminase [Clostridium sp.]|uniref:adenosine deaminase n=1 Tax=unclassified Clostridium TaxID=2614128 RepID=UPI000EEEFD79|nr:adenosine deaminase [Clostridium sp.]